ncbi:MAG: putative DNA-binding protein [Marmoricola sp.]|nr:putative DNA-binding protein [Marmoricola sp.]
MGALSVRVLGDLEIGGLETRTLADRKARLVLRLLALARGRAIPTAALADAVWGDNAPSRPADQVAVLVSRLRRALGRDRIEYGDHGYQLIYDWLDLDELAGVTAEAEHRHQSGNNLGAVAACRIALTLIRGPLPALGTEADWAQADLAAANRLVRRARRTAAAAMLETGEWLDALDLAAVDLQDDPYDEEAARHLMRAHVLAGRPGAALAVFASLRATLEDDLGTDPAAETGALHEAILRGELPSAAQHRSTERPAAAVVGRQHELDRLDALADPITGMRIVGISGEAGIGKTTLVSAWSRRRAEGGDTLLFGTCGALDRSTPLDVLLGAIAEHLRRADDPGSLLAEDAALLGPLLGMSVARGPEDQHAPVSVLGPANLYAAITAVLERIAGSSGAILVIDDAHLAGQALADWARFALRRSPRLLVVAAARLAEGVPLPITDELVLRPLDAQETAELVGADRADELFARSGGHPLFLSELVNTPASAETVPPSLVDAVEQRCADLGSAADLLRAAAVLGNHLDLDLLASVLGRPTLDVLADAELAEDRQLLVERGGRYSFRHDLVREALAISARAGRAALLHREAGRILARRPSSDAVEVAEHARLGGDLVQAALSLRVAAARAAERFDHATAEALLDESLTLDPLDATLLERARVRTRRGHYTEAESDVTAAAGAGAEAWEVGAWAAYFDRRFDDAIRFARDGETSTEDPVLRARCLTVGGRTLHARGDLDGAEKKLTAAVAEAQGQDRLTAAAWLGVLKSHRSRSDEALELLGPVAHAGAGVDLTSATLHALLFTGHAYALAGRPEAAITALARYTTEVERRQVPRFAGRGVNMSGWVLRNIGAHEAALDANEEALDTSPGKGAELPIAALEDLADEQLRIGDPQAAAAFLDQVAPLLVGDLVFGWRLDLKHALLRARIALESDPEQALAEATALVAAATAMNVPRYSSVGRLLVHRAHAMLGVEVDPEVAGRDLDEVENAVRIEAWWWAGETGAALGWDHWVRRAETLAAELARSAGPCAEALHTDADRRLADWRLRLR